MFTIDVFHGDADGLCAIQQFRLSEPLGDRQVVTGKRSQHALLAGIGAATDCGVVMLDLPLDINHATLQQLLAQGCQVRCFDHHVATKSLEHDNLTLHLDSSAEVCTSILVNRHLGGAYAEWAAVGAFGDNMFSAAQQLLQESELSQHEVEQLVHLAELLNYNAYGDMLNANHVTAAEMHEQMLAHEHPLDFLHDNRHLKRISTAMEEDLERQQTRNPSEKYSDGMVYMLPSREFIRRSYVVWVSRLMRKHPDIAFLIAIENHDGSLDISIRSPLNAAKGAWELAKAFGGGGREGAAGINGLPAGRVKAFLQTFWAWSADLYQQQRGCLPERQLK